MQFKLSVLYTLATVLVTASAAAVPDIEPRAPKLLLINFEKLTANVTGLEISKRSGYYPNALHNERLFYVTYLDIGSNKQKIGVDIDTGSSDLWVPDVNAGGNHGDWLFGSYSPDDSSTAKNTGEEFAIGYVDGTGTTGYYYKDTVSLGDSDLATLKNFQFADATTSSIGWGIFGIGPDGEEATSSTYPNFLDRLKSDGVIATKGYSIFLNEPDATSGTVIFGGKDLDKIDGKLVPQKIVDPSNLAIKLDSVTVNGKTYNSGADSILDTGTSYAALTRELGDEIFSNYDNGHYDEQSGVWLVDSDKNVDQPITFNFNGISITTSFEAAYSDNIKDGYGNYYGPGFKVIPYKLNLLGDILLSQAYVVYNYDEETISIAKPKFTSSSNVVPI